MKHLACVPLLLFLFVPVLFPALTLAALHPAVPALRTSGRADVRLQAKAGGEVEAAFDPAPANPAPRSSRTQPPAGPTLAWEPAQPATEESLREEAFVLLRPAGGRAQAEGEPLDDASVVGLVRWARFESGTGRTLLERELVLAGAARWIGSETYFSRGSSDIAFKGVWRDVEPQRGRVLVLTQPDAARTLSRVDACYGDVVRRSVELEPGDAFPLGLVEELREKPFLIAARRRFLPFEGRFVPTRIVSAALLLPGLPRLACEYDSSGAVLSWYVLLGKRVLALRLSGSGPVAVAVPPSTHAASRARFEPLAGPAVEASHER